MHNCFIFAVNYVGILSLRCCFPIYLYRCPLFASLYVPCLADKSFIDVSLLFNILYIFIYVNILYIFIYVDTLYI